MNLFLTQFMSLTPSKQAILYSLHANLTLGQLKNEHFTDPEATLNAPDVIQLRQRMESHHITAITSNMPEYPEKFFHSKTPPYLIYAMGNLSLLQQKTLGIV
jgi:predicted Rossmann fold nucleotide-binding protein DprA/Smf involved in DNA uptake